MFQLFEISLLHEAVYLTGLIALRINQGWKHGLYYSRLGSDPYSHPFYRSKWGIHEADWVFSAILFSLLFLAGCDPIRIYGAYCISALPFQMLVNIAEGLPAINPNEDKHWRVFGINVPKFLTGRGKLAKPVYGLLLCFYEPFITKILQLL